MSRLKRTRNMPAEVLELISRQTRRLRGPVQAETPYQPTIVYGDEQPAGGGGGVTIDSEAINQSCADNGTTNIEIGDVTEIAAIKLAYQCTTGAYYEAGSAVLFTDGTSAAVCAWQRSYLGSGYCLDDDLGLAGDVSSGVLRLKVTTKSLGSACDFRATYLIVEA